MLGGVREVGVASRLLTLREGEGDSDLAAGLQPLAPEGAGRYFHCGKGHGVDGVPVSRLLLFLGC